ncbi:MAG: hypothetical protein AAFN04_14715, partial [Pseudomonadota bacterium]
MDHNQIASFRQDKRGLTVRIDRHHGRKPFASDGAPVDNAKLTALNVGGIVGFALQGYRVTRLIGARRANGFNAQARFRVKAVKGDLHIGIFKGKVDLAD